MKKLEKATSRLQHVDLMAHSLNGFASRVTQECTLTRDEDEEVRSVQEGFSSFVRNVTLL